MRHITLHGYREIVRQVQSQESSAVQHVTLSGVLVHAQLVGDVAVVQIVRCSIPYRLAILIQNDSTVGIVHVVRIYRSHRTGCIERVRVVSTIGIVVEVTL